jgi:proline dehydrogenase
VRLLFDAEQAAVQPGIDQWTLQYMKKYNTTPGRAVIYGTYQAYLKSTPSTLAAHLGAARDGDFTLGVKLVRGAYLGSDPRGLIRDRKEDTDAAYDSIARSVLTAEWGDVLVGSGSFPHTSLVLATHNAQSVQLARGIYEASPTKTDVAFAQLQGMADEVSCALVCGFNVGDKRTSGRFSPQPRAATERGRAPLQTYKYLVWGSIGDCMKYLLRRAHENRDAVERTKSCRDAMWNELWRRTKAVFWSGASS